MAKRQDKVMEGGDLGSAVKHVAEQCCSTHHMVGQHKVAGGFDGETNVPGASATKHERDKPGV